MGNNPYSGTLFVISGPSGSGKGTILSEVIKRSDNIYYSVSATTRGKREGEVDGVNYHFVTKDDFEDMITKDEVLEYAQYCGNYYGTPLKPVEDMLKDGKDVILEIEVVGALNVMKKCPYAVSVFILPPSISELDRRLMKRGTESRAVIEARLDEAKREIKTAEKYDYIVVNGELEEAIQNIQCVINSQKHKNEKSKKLIEEVLSK